jgi:hypothetical protein
MRKLILVLAMLALLFIGTVTAGEIPTTSVTGKIIVPANSVVVTPPAAYTPWNLTYDKVNILTAGDIHVVANCDYTLYLLASTGGYMIGEQGPAMSFPTLKYPVLVFVGNNTWSPVEGTNRTQLVIWNGHPGTVDIPLKLRQDLHPDDADKIDPKIVFSYAVTIP